MMKSGCTPTAPQSLRATSMARTFVEATSRALTGRDCGDLAETADTNWLGAPSTGDLWHSSRVAATAVPIDHVGRVDADAVAQWVVDQYGDGAYPTAVLGSAHGSAAHLALALGAPWLPLAFDVDVAWPEGSTLNLDAAMRHGGQVAQELIGRNPSVRVKQVHDPVRYGHLTARQSSHHIAWRDLPEPYRRFLRTRVRADGQLLLVKDERRWPDASNGEHAAFQLGSPTSGLRWSHYLDELATVSPACAATARMLLGQGASSGTPAEYGVATDVERELHRWANEQGRTLVGIGYRSPELLSAAVADLYRAWLRAAGKTGNRLAVECGRLLDPYHVVRAGLVPYWCEVSTSAAVSAAEDWLAGSEEFTVVEPIPEPTGSSWSTVAHLEQWNGLVAFASVHGSIDRRLARVYPSRCLAPRDATAVLQPHPYDMPTPTRMTVPQAVSRLAALAMNDPRHSPLSGLAATGSARSAD
jgi:hypothetical protein